MVTKNSNYKVKLPTQLRSKKSTKKVLAKEGDKHNYSIIKCVICNKQKMEKYDLIDEQNNKVTIRHCKNCKFTNASNIIFENTPSNTPPITYFKTSGALEDRISRK